MPLVESELQLIQLIAAGVTLATNILILILVWRLVRKGK